MSTDTETQSAAVTSIRAAGAAESESGKCLRRTGPQSVASFHPAVAAVLALGGPNGDRLLGRLVAAVTA
jgi:hypothetical protein